MDKLEERVRSIIVEQLGVNEEQVTPDASFIDDLSADSLDTVELIMAFESEFDMEIEDDEVEQSKEGCADQEGNFEDKIVALTA
jgi:acyl carrier protein